MKNKNILNRRSFLGRGAVATGILSLGGGLMGASMNPANAQEIVYDYVRGLRVVFWPTA